MQQASSTIDKLVSTAGTSLSPRAVSPPRFVVNLCASTTPVGLVQPTHAGLKRFTFFVSRRLEEGRERFRLHMGYFESQEEAEKMLDLVRDVYPAAWAGAAPGIKLRARAALPEPAPVEQTPAAPVAAASPRAPAAPAVPIVAVPRAAPPAATPPDAPARRDSCRTCVRGYRGPTQAGARTGPAARDAPRWRCAPNGAGQRCDQLTERCARDHCGPRRYGRAAGATRGGDARRRSGTATAHFRASGAGRAIGAGAARGQAHGRPSAERKVAAGPCGETCRSAGGRAAGARGVRRTAALVRAAHRHEQGAAAGHIQRLHALRRGRQSRWPSLVRPAARVLHRRGLGQAGGAVCALGIHLGVGGPGDRA